MAKKFGKFLLGATLLTGVAAAAYWYKKNYLDTNADSSDFDDFDDFNDLDSEDDFEDFGDFEEEEASPSNYVPINLNQDEASTLDEIDDELSEALAEEALESIQNL